MWETWVSGTVNGPWTMGTFLPLSSSPWRSPPCRPNENVLGGKGVGIIISFLSLLLASAGKLSFNKKHDGQVWERLAWSWRQNPIGECRTVHRGKLNTDSLRHPRQPPPYRHSPATLALLNPDPRSWRFSKKEGESLQLLQQTKANRLN